jgi:dCTP deaminase
MLIDKQIENYVRTHRMIDPFIDHEENNGRVTYGLTSAGYDARLGKGFYIADKVDKPQTISPATEGGKFPGTYYERKMVRLPPQTLALAFTQEIFTIPVTICATVVGKSTWARLGLQIFVTPLEPGWTGQITIEMFNAGFTPIELREGDAICQVQFHEIQVPRVNYQTKHGRYQGQRGIVFAMRAKGDGHDGANNEDGNT